MTAGVVNTLSFVAAAHPGPGERWLSSPSLFVGG